MYASGPHEGMKHTVATGGLQVTEVSVAGSVGVKQLVEGGGKGEEQSGSKGEAHDLDELAA